LAISSAGGGVTAEESILPPIHHLEQVRSNIVEGAVLRNKQRDACEQTERWPPTLAPDGLVPLEVQHDLNDRDFRKNQMR
jgi:hypothetical protein